MKQKMILPCGWAQCLSVVLAFFLTLLVLLTGVTAGLNLMLCTTPLHESVALDPAVREAQMERITAKVEKLAQQNGFAPETAMALITPEAMDAYNVGMIGWWQGLLQESPAFTAPAWDAASLEAAIAADEGFVAAHEERMLKSASRDAAADVAAAIQEAVLPIRANLISFAFSKVLGKIDVAKYMAYLPYVPWATGLAAALMAAVIMLLCARRPVRGAAIAGSGLCAGGLSVGVAMAAFALLDVPAMVSGMSAMLGLQVSLAMEKLAILLGAGAAVCVLTGLVLIFLHQKAMVKLRRRLAKAEAAA